MGFLESVDRARAFLERRGRVSLRALQRESGLDDDALGELIDELVDIQRVAVRDGRALTWTGGRSDPAVEPRHSRAPRNYTPRHLVEKILTQRSALQGERKQVTVLFADVKGSTDLAQALDPEAWHRILDRFFQVLAEGVHRFEGTVNQYTGDGIMALFGAPIAHEDHAQRACYAALWLRDALRRLSDELRATQGLELGVRMGLHTGEVVVGKIGDDLRMDYTAQGHTVGLAARMEGLASVGGVCVSEATARLVEGYVALCDLGETAIKGVREPVRVFAVEGPGELRTRFDRARSRGLSRFVGRDADMAVLEHALEQALAGRGQVVGVVAEAGAGKSRLCFEFVERCRARGLPVFQAAAVAHGHSIPLLPILELLRRYFGVSEDDADAAARDKVAERLLRIDASLGERLPVVLEFLGLADPELSAPPIDGDARQRQLFDVVHRLVAGGGEVGVTFIEDLHWLDPGSEPWLAQLVEAVAGARSLLLMSFRPEYRAPWMQKSWYRQIPLLPLAPEATRVLLHDLLGSHPSLGGLADAIHARTLGNPFFAEEIVQDLMECGSLRGSRGACELCTPLAALKVPATVQSVLAARVDRLGEPEKQVLQAASVVGREFSEAILGAVLDWPEGDLRAALRSLEEGEFVYTRSLYPLTEYAFKHPLTQEVALGSQLRERRARLHAAVAVALEAAHADRLDEHAGLLAHHHEASGDALQAARWHRRAASWQLGRDEHSSALHTRRVHELAVSLPDSQETLQMRLEACGRLVVAAYQLGTPRAERDRLASEARAIAERLGDRGALFMQDVYLGISVTLTGWSGRAPLVEARRAVALGEELGLDLQLRAMARANLANIAWTAGRVPETLRGAEETLALVHGSPDLGIETAALSLAVLAQYIRWGALLWSGRFAEAARCLEDAVEEAHNRGDMLESQMLSQGPATQELTGIAQQAVARCREAALLAERSRDLFNRTVTTLHLGWAQLLEGDAEAALESLLRAEHLQRERGVAGNTLNLGQGLLAEAYLAVGDAKNARVAADGCVAELDAWVWELRGNLVRARVLRSLDGPDGRAQVEASLARAEQLLEWSGARAFAPLLEEERARLAAVLGEEEAAASRLRRARELYDDVEATGHAQRLAAELGG